MEIKTLKYLRIKDGEFTSLKCNFKNNIIETNDDYFYYGQNPTEYSFIDFDYSDLEITTSAKYHFSIHFRLSKN